MRPRLLRPDNLTPATRTPWGGRVIARRIKRGLELGLGASSAHVGESWEVSTEPSFPSRFADDDTPLAAAIASDPVAWLGAGVARRFHGQNPLLVKLLDAASDLSIQVHPALGDPDLEPDQSGKPEGWYVLSAAPGAGLYLGFAPGVDRDRVARCVAECADLSRLMNFVPVAPGDAFFIPAGLAHAVGAGVTLLEPQLTNPGQRGVTYRFWDWNRRYDEHGRLSSQGSARPLQLERALAVTDFGGPAGPSLVDASRAHPTPLDSPHAPAPALRRTRLIHWPHFVLERWHGAGRLSLEPFATMLAAVCVAGAARISCPAGELHVQRGQSAVIPAAAGALAIESRAHPDDGPADLELLVTRVPPDASRDRA